MCRGGSHVTSMFCSPTLTAGWQGYMCMGGALHVTSMCCSPVRESTLTGWQGYMSRGGSTCYLYVLQPCEGEYIDWMARLHEQGRLYMLPLCAAAL